MGRRSVAERIAFRSSVTLADVLVGIVGVCCGYIGGSRQQRMLLLVLLHSRVRLLDEVGLTTLA